MFEYYHKIEFFYISSLILGLGLGLSEWRDLFRNELYWEGPLS